MTSATRIAGSRQQIVATLRAHMGRMEGLGQVAGEQTAGGKAAGDGGKVLANGTVLDRLLPERGFPRGKLVEWLAGGEGSGVGMLALLAARAATAGGGALVVLDRRRSFYPPAAAALGVELEQVMVVRAGSLDDELWACDQALRCSGVAAVWGEMDRLPARWFRRLQLAAERGGGIGHLLRPARVRGWPSWSYAQLVVEPLPSMETRSGGGRRWRVELARCHGLARGGVMEVELDEMTGAIRETVHETGALHLAAQLAHPTPRRRSARA